MRCGAGESTSLEGREAAILVEGCIRLLKHSNFLIFWCKNNTDFLIIQHENVPEILQMCPLNAMLTLYLYFLHSIKG